jgi:hypothetical protein
MTATTQRQQERGDERLLLTCLILERLWASERRRRRVNSARGRSLLAR